MEILVLILMQRQEKQTHKWSSYKRIFAVSRNFVYKTQSGISLTTFSHLLVALQILLPDPMVYLAHPMCVFETTRTEKPFDTKSGLCSATRQPAYNSHQGSIAWSRPP